MTVALRWAPTARLRRLVLVAALGVAGAVVTGHGELLALAAAPLVLLCLGAPGALPRIARLTTRLEQDRCVEGDELTVELSIEVAGIDDVRAALEAPPHTRSRFEPVAAAARGRPRWILTPGRWGRYPVGPLRLWLVAPGGCYQAVASTDVGEIVVFPAAAALARAVAPRELAAPLGEHRSRAVGSGVEFAGVRPYAPGDRQRDVDWRSTARHQRLLVREYAAERAFDLVLVLDTAGDAGEPGSSTLDLTVRAASGLARSYLRAHDRVGVLTFGGPLRWLSPATGPRQHHQVHETLMSVRPDAAERDAATVSYGLELLPARMLPRRAFVAMVSPLLDERVLEAVRVLRERGFTPLVIDVLTTEPTVRPGSDAVLALRAWRLQRQALTAELATMGVAVLPWDGAADLTGALGHAMRAQRAGARA